MITINLKNLLESRGLNQAELARIMGIRPSTICGIYHDNCTFLKVENIDKICVALKCTPADLISFSGGEDE
ncbi:MAG: helix-turn-helix transcriptional regulator [Ruminococcus sp.]|nr:helix-turn-helix transcriptional regulator [Ruminococcus sp.]